MCFSYSVVRNDDGTPPVRGTRKTANSFEVFCCRKKARNGAVTRGVCEIKQNFFLLKMREITCLCAIGKDPGQKENLMV